MIPDSSDEPGISVTLDNCADEPIHIPGKIQPHGALLVFDQECRLLAWSANADAMLGFDLKLGLAAGQLPAPPEVLAHLSTCQRKMLDGETPTSSIETTLGAQHFDCIVHAHQRRLLLEFELREPSAEKMSAVALTGQSAIDGFMRQKSVLELLNLAVARVREITGFDRVMVYRFRDDDSGEVVAENRLDTLTPYLGQRYPASDIPSQARRLYIINTLRLIGDVGYAPVPMVEPDADAAIDMSHSVLRSVSPIHIEYLQNMGVGASMSVSIVISGRLWGLLTCHHRSARHVPYPIRVACDLLAHVLATKVQSLEAETRARLMCEAALVRSAVIDTLRGDTGADMLPGLFRHAPDLRRCFHADAIVIAQYGEVRCFGDIPGELAGDMVQALPRQYEEVLQLVSVDDWPRQVQPLLGKWVGLLGICFDWANNGWILALRVEQIETVRWGGRPTKELKAGPMGERLTPRGSFDEWRETVRGRCEPWDDIGLNSASQLLAKIHGLRAAELLRRATHDLLTGLPNRALLLERVGNALKRSTELGADVALLFIDLDGFKQINDAHGHIAGDLLLDTVAQRLLGEVRGADTVARLAGDEFVVLCPQIGKLSEMESLAQRINAALRVPMLYEGIPLSVSASIGIAAGRGATHSAEDLLRYSDAAMYAVKHSGRDNWQLFNLDLHAQVQRRKMISNGLRHALERREFSVRYQPIVVADSGRIVGAELLLRWAPPEGEISPSVFIPVAEMTRAIVPIGAWVFSQACIAETVWRARWGAEAPYVSVNLSARQLSEESLPEDFADLLGSSGADPTRIVLEITETALMADVDANLKVLRRLAMLGVRVAVDDFGTGYSSLAQLTRMPVDILKIDRAFIDGVDFRAESRTVVKAVIALGHSLGLRLIAEGVETEAQRRELCAHGCDFIQGYHFHRPMLETALLAEVDQQLAGAAHKAVDL